MLTYILLIASAIYLLVKWAFYHAYKKKAMTREQIDSSLIDRLKIGDSAHAD